MRFCVIHILYTIYRTLSMKNGKIYHNLYTINHIPYTIKHIPKTIYCKPYTKKHIPEDADALLFLRVDTMPIIQSYNLGLPAVYNIMHVIIDALFDYHGKSFGLLLDENEIKRKNEIFLADKE